MFGNKERSTKHQEPASTPRTPANEVLRQRLIEPHAGVQRDVIDAALGALLLVLLAEGADFGEVILTITLGVDDDRLLRLRVFELARAAEGEFDLGLVQHVEQNHVMPAVPQAVERFD